MNSNNLFNNQCFDNLDEEEIYDSPVRRNFAYLSNNTSSQQFKSNRIRKNKSNNKETSLWWDEDVALNELTSSISSITS